MMTTRRFLSLALPVLALAASLAGCEMFSSEAWQRPSPLSGRPPPPPPDEKHENRGGFTVLVGAPGQPTTARVFADVDAFARGRGFVRWSENPPPDAASPAAAGTAAVAPARYALGDIRLDVTFQSTDLRVVATLHSFSSKLSRKFSHQFYEDFRQRYGADASMHENDDSDDAGGGFQGDGGSPGGGRGRR